MTERVPELSLAAFTGGDPVARLAFSDDLMRGLQRFGFVILKDHNVPASLLEQAYGLAEQTFALPEAVKRRHAGGTSNEELAAFELEHGRVPGCGLKEKCSFRRWRNRTDAVAGR